LERANGAGYGDGFIAGCKNAGVMRDKGGRFASLHPRKNYGVIHGADEDFASIERVETPDRRKASSCPD
jgi:hypothetical protein